MKRAGRIGARTHEHLQPMIEPGRTTLELDEAAEQFIRDRNAQPAFREYGDFSHAISVSINDELIHAPPRADRTIRRGDVVSVDLGAKFRGHYSDTAVTVVAGESDDPRVETLVRRTRSGLYAGVMEAVAGHTLEDIGRALERSADEVGNVTEWAGHFIGRRLHLAPRIYSRPHLNEHYRLRQGRCVAIEPIYTLTPDGRTVEDSPGGIVRTRSGAVGAHFEHTVWVHEDRAEILTARSEEKRFL